MTQTQCDLCEGAAPTSPYDIPASIIETQIMICAICEAALPAPSSHWQCLTATMWSETPGVQIMAYRLLKRQALEAWAQDALDMLYMDEETLAWAQAGIMSAAAPTRDSNGTILQAGDTVTLIKDLPVKGAGFTAKRGTSVRSISLTDNPEHIEGKVNGQRIVLVSAFLKKSG